MHLIILSSKFYKIRQNIENLQTTGVRYFVTENVYNFQFELFELKNNQVIIRYSETIFF